MTTHANIEAHGNVLEVHLRGRLAREDYEKFVPESENMIRLHGKIRILVVLEDFQGWDAGAIWEDIKWDAKHFRDIERVAVVGDKQWDRWMAVFCKAFTTAKVRHFEPGQLLEAGHWVEAVES